ncbi:MAG: MCP four helix bundle domain-containing protein, partial [Proteobacteria bacterium]|nr:MCP four helix bundle domain-containing protein [Pseudomonadota bacterium]
MIKKSFKSLNISNKLAVIFLVLLVMMGVGGSVGLYNGRQIAKVTDHLFMDSFQRTEILSSIEKDLLHQRQELFLHTIISEFSSKSYLEGSLGEIKNKIDRKLSEYESLGSSGLEAHFNDLTSSLPEYWDVQAHVVSLSMEGKRDLAITLIQGNGNVKFAATMNALKQLINEENNTAFSAYRTIKSFAATIIIVTLIFTVLAIFVAGGMWLATTRSIVVPIRAIEESAKRIAGGDLSQRVPVMTQDELGSLAGEFNQMAENIEEHNATLEDRVHQRTSQLERTNLEMEDQKKEIEKNNVELVHANEMKSQFLANVSHEFRTPLNSIIGFSELLKEKSFGDLNDKQLEYLDYIRSSGDNLLTLINNILDISRIEVGNMELEPDEFSFTEILGETLSILRPLAHKREITINTKTSPASPIIRADRAKFKQILLNLISNAVKFNVDNGTVDIDWEIREEPSGMVMEHVLILSVTDSGIGIDEKDISRIFKEFEQVDSSISREYDGSGLGLALTEKLVKLHKGEIWVESTPGKGSTFSVKLPQGTERIDMPVFSRSPSLNGGAGRSSKLLIACESDDLNQLLSIYLAGEPYDIITVDDGFDLVEKASSEEPFSIIMGVALARRDGWEVMAELKSSEATKDIPVVFLSSAEDKERAFS